MLKKVKHISLIRENPDLESNQSRLCWNVYGITRTTGKPLNTLINSNICCWLPVALKGGQKELYEWINFLMRPCSPIQYKVIEGRILNVEILMNLLPPFLAHYILNGVMNWGGFRVSIPVVVDMGLNMDSHIDKNPKVCKNLGRSNWFPATLIVGVMESDVLGS